MFTIESRDTLEAVVGLVSIATGERHVLFPGAIPHYISSGHIIFARDGALWRVPFDPDSREVRGDAEVVLGGLREPRRAVRGRVQWASVTRSGTLAYVPSRDDAEARRSLLQVDRSGRGEPLIDAQDYYSYPRVSPEGDRVAVAIGTRSTIDILDPSDIWMIETARGSRTRLTFESTGTNRFFPVWSPDGRRMVYSTSGEDANTRLRVTSTDGTGDAIELFDLDTPGWPYSWSPDGQTLAFYEISPEGSRDILMLPMDGAGQPRPFVVTRFHERSPVFSPGGRWLAYLSDKNGRTDVYVTTYPDADREIPISAGGGTEVVWSRDGGELFYRTVDSLMAVSFDPDTGRAGAPRRLFEDDFDRDRASGATSANYDVTEDGDFLMVGNLLSAGTQLVLVQNWLSELERLEGD